MTLNKLLLLFLLFALTTCERRSVVPETESTALKPDGDRISGHSELLLLSRYQSLDDLKSVVEISYLDDSTTVCLDQQCWNNKASSELTGGASQDDFTRAANGSLWDKIWLGLRCPFAVVNKNALVSIETLGRRKPEFGHGDVAFFDLAELMVGNISDDDKAKMSDKDLSEKGYLNTFNHVIAQAMMTSIFSESIADFVSDAHERKTMPELITGKFSADQLADLENGPVDNYVDMINNEWGQALGKELRQKFKIDRRSNWTPQLLADYLNDIQAYHSWNFQIAFRPFTPEDETIVRFTSKLNTVLSR